MPTLHMETEQVRAAGQHLAQAARDLRAEVDQLNQQLRRLEGAWHGSSSHSFMREADFRIAELRRLVQEGMELAGRLQHEVEEWETVDGTGG